MFDRTQSMLPKTATDLARALDILEERLFRLPVAMISKDPMTVSEALLDHLAWENSVDVWDVDWPEDIKRSVVAMSAEVHRFKGTPYAIKRALDALGVSTELVEWWQASPEAARGTFDVTAYAGRALYSDEDVFINQKMVRSIIAVLERVAPVSRGFTIAVGAKLRPQPMRMAVNASAISFARFRMKVIQQTPRLPVQSAPAGHASAISFTRARVG
jgi:phage tail P2-like protein